MIESKRRRTWAASAALLILMACSPGVEDEGTLDGTAGEGSLPDDEDGAGGAGSGGVKGHDHSHGDGGAAAGGHDHGSGAAATGGHDHGSGGAATGGHDHGPGEGGTDFGGSGPGDGGAGTGGHDHGEGTGAGSSAGGSSGGSSGGGDTGAGGAGTGGHDHSGSTGGSSGDGGSGSGGAPPVDHCVVGYDPHPADGSLTGLPMEWVSPMNGAVDLVLPQPIVDWMEEQKWMPAHDAWHKIRRCVSQPFLDACVFTEVIPEDQECENAQDGLNFLAAHRHMIEILNDLFPSHPELFEGFLTFPFEAEDVPLQWQSRFGTGWNASILNVATVLESIEDNLEQFPTEGDLGKYIQCGLGSSGAGSIHGALHFKWAVGDSPYSLGKQTVNISNYMFYKLHGWIDDIWERYRVAKGMSPDDPVLRQAVTEQCHHMHALTELFQPEEEEEEPLPEETGYFHEQVRPLFESAVHKCSSCHSESSPSGAMSLGGSISSADIVGNLVGVQSVYGGQFLRVVPYDPYASWLYLKASGLAASAGCVGASCSSTMMPPGSSTSGQDGALSEAELDILLEWILDGAPAPP